ncbi:MAG TPA: DNA oxidative demethylase AlkB [Burkholderiales bacterium]|nr:DNA oxidative demethylase AlkB [Burkholderiales bacterium]
MTADLFEQLPDIYPSRLKLAEGAVLLRRFVKDIDGELLHALDAIAAQAPFRHLTTPGGYRMSVAMTCCGRLGWVSDRSGYRYEPCDPETGLKWPVLPEIFAAVASRAASEAGYNRFIPDTCLINRYEPGARLSLHQDKNERDSAAPIVSVSLGLAAVFLFGGAERNDRPQRYRLEHGDVAVWGGASRFNFHGIAPVADGYHPLLGRKRINLTFRKVG